MVTNRSIQWNVSLLILRSLEDRKASGLMAEYSVKKTVIKGGNWLQKEDIRKSCETPGALEKR